MSKIKVSDLVLGQWIRVRYTNVGVRDVLICEFNKNKLIEKDQILSIGPRISVPKF